MFIFRYDPFCTMKQTDPPVVDELLPLLFLLFRSLVWILARRQAILIGVPQLLKAMQGEYLKTGQELFHPSFKTHYSVILQLEAAQRKEYLNQESNKTKCAWFVLCRYFIRNTARCWMSWHVSRISLVIPITCLNRTLYSATTISFHISSLPFNSHANGIISRYVTSCS